MAYLNLYVSILQSSHNQCLLGYETQQWLSPVFVYNSGIRVVKWLSWWREQPPRGPPWVSGLVGHFVQTWPDSECSHTLQCLDCSDLNWRCNRYHLFLARYDPFGVDVPLNFDNTHSLTIVCASFLVYVLQNGYRLRQFSIKDRWEKVGNRTLVINAIGNYCTKLHKNYGVRQVFERYSRCARVPTACWDCKGLD